MLAQNIHPKVVQERLGHSTVGDHPGYLHSRCSWAPRGRSAGLRGAASHTTEAYGDRRENSTAYCKFTHPCSDSYRGTHPYTNTASHSIAYGNSCDFSDTVAYRDADYLPSDTNTSANAHTNGVFTWPNTNNVSANSDTSTNRRLERSVSRRDALSVSH